MKKKKKFKSREHLIHSIESSMPDEFPSGYATWLADKMIAEGSVEFGC